MLNDEYVINRIDYDWKNLEEKIHQMLCKWEQQTPNLIDLASALNTLKRCELIKEIEQLTGFFAFSNWHYFYFVLSSICYWDKNFYLIFSLKKIN